MNEFILEYYFKLLTSVKNYFGFVAMYVILYNGNRNWHD